MAREQASAGSNDQRGNGRQGGRRNAPAREPRSKNYDEEVISIRRVDKVVKGGRRSSFGAFVVLGDSKGKVGWGMAKARQVPLPSIRPFVLVSATLKAILSSMVPSRTKLKVVLARAVVRLLPASEGTGVIAGKSVRYVLEKLGVHNVLSKCYGSNNPINVVKATFDALAQLKTKEQYQELRGVEL